MSAQTDYSVQAEQCLIAGLLADNRSYFKVCGLLEPADFYVPNHRRIYSSIGKLLAKNEPADALTVAEDLDGDAGLAEIGEIAKGPGVPVNAVSYAKIVKDRARRRNTRLALHNALAALDKEPVENVIADTMSSLQNLAHSGQYDTSFSDALDEAQADAEAAMKRRSSGSVLGVSTTLPTLDRLTGGLHGRKMIVVGGRPGTYKSAFALQMALRAASQGTAVGIVSLEMGASELGSRAIAHELKINGHAFAAGDQQAVHAVKEQLKPEMHNWPIRIDDKSSYLGEIVARIVEWKYRYDIQIACVDHLQLVQHENSTNRFLELSEASRQFKLLAMRLNIPILVLSQLSRSVEKEKREPRLSDLRECGNIEQDADVVIFTHCEKIGEGPGEDQYQLILAKQRGGPARQVIDIVVNGERFFVGELGR